MKRKSIAILLLALLLLLSAAGCGNAEESSQTESPESVVSQEPVVYGDPDLLVIVNPNYFGGEESDYRTRFEQHLADSGINMQILLPAPQENESYTDWVLRSFSENALNGMVYVADYAQFQTLLAAGVIEPVGSYLTESDYWKSLPDAFRNAYRYGTDYYAIPADGSYTFPTVGYMLTDSAALLEPAETASDSGESLPQSPETSPEISQETSPETSFSTEEPAPDPAAEKLAAYVEFLKTAAAEEKRVISAGLSSFGWLFEASGAPLGSFGSNIYYNPEKQEVIDAMLLEGAEQALETLRGLYAAGAVDESLLTNTLTEIETALKEGTALSASYVAGGFDGYAELTEYASTEYVTTTGGGYCLLKNTAQPGESVNKLCELLWGDGWEKMYMGIEGYTRDESGNLILEYRSKTERTAFPSPSLCATLPGVKNAGDNIKFFSDTPKETMESVRQSADYYKELYAKGFADGRLKVLDHRYTGIRSKLYSENGAAFTAAFYELLRTVLTDPETTVGSALEAYRAQMLTLGGNAMLEQANAALGMSCVYTYGDEPAAENE